MPADVRCEGLSKRYSVRQPVTGSWFALGARLRSWRGGERDFWALRDVSFEVPCGQCLGVIGHNGAGKTTLFKLLSRVTAPTAGQVTIRGRLAALIEIGSGFHPDLTGRENVFLSGSLLGMRRREVAEKLPSIVDFAEIGDFLDTPVKKYSWGMYVRLGFAVPAHLSADVLLVDEVLAVGDTAFQRKCFARMTELKQRGVTVVLISHDLGAIEQLCDRALLLDHGAVAADDRPSAVIDRYRHLVSARGTGTPGPSTGTNALEITALEISGHADTGLATEEPMAVRIAYRARRSVPDVIGTVGVHGLDGRLQCELTTERHGPSLTLAPGRGVLEFRCGQLGLRAGFYDVVATLRQAGGPAGQMLSERRLAAVRVDPGSRPVSGQFHMPSTWVLTED
jgi:homopolymeric O-antigen transport system ATP-binding protein